MSKEQFNEIWLLIIISVVRTTFNKDEGGPHNSTGPSGEGVFGLSSSNFPEPEVQRQALGDYNATAGNRIASHSVGHEDGRPFFLAMSGLEQRAAGHCLWLSRGTAILWPIRDKTASWQSCDTL